MGILRILIKGMIRSWQKRSLAVRLWAVNLLFSLFAVAPFFFLMMKHMSHSFSGEHALHKLDIFWLGDFIYRYRNVAPAVLGLRRCWPLSCTSSWSFFSTAALSAA